MSTKRATAAQTGIGSVGLRRAAARILPLCVFAALPALVVSLALHAAATDSSGRFAYWDFRALWQAGHAVLQGHTPYPSANPRVLSGEQSFVYPAPAALVAVPFAAIPFQLAGAIFALLGLAALLLALRLAGVRDWRCYGVAMLSEPALEAITLGTVTPLLALALALTWRYRNRPVVAAVALAAALVLKVFVWPVLLWLAFTGRRSAALLSAALSAVVALAAWAVLGFDGLRGYPHLLSTLTRVLEGKGFSLVALGLSFGAGTTIARALAILVGATCLAAIALRGHRENADAWTFVVATGAVLALSPIVWLHYFALLLVPLAIAAPQLSWPWFVPLLFWVVGGQSETPIWSHTHWADLAASPRTGKPWLVTYGVVLAAFLATTAARSVLGQRPKHLGRRSDPSTGSAL